MNSNAGGMKKKGTSVKSKEETIAGFMALKDEQRDLAMKMTEMVSELNEHRHVIENIKDLEPTRKCFRMIGGVLVEQTVGVVLPALETNEENLMKIIANIEKQLTTKGEEINRYKDENNLEIKGGVLRSNLGEGIENKSEAIGAS